MVFKICGFSFREPEDSKVYEIARKMALDDENILYFEWINRPTFRGRNSATIIHQGIVETARFLSDMTKILTTNEEGLIKVKLFLQSKKLKWHDILEIKFVKAIHWTSLDLECEIRRSASPIHRPQSQGEIAVSLPWWVVVTVFVLRQWLRTKIWPNFRRGDVCVWIGRRHSQSLGGGIICGRVGKWKQGTA